MTRTTSRDVRSFVAAFSASKSAHVSLWAIRYEAALERLAGKIAMSVGGGALDIVAYHRASRAIEAYRSEFAASMQAVVRASLAESIEPMVREAISGFVAPERLPKAKSGRRDVLGGVHNYFYGHYGTLSSRIRKPLLLSLAAKQDAGAVVVAMSNVIARQRAAGRQLLSTVHSHVWNGSALWMLRNGLYLVSLTSSRDDGGFSIRQNSLRRPGEPFFSQIAEGYVHPPGSFADPDVMIPWNLEWGTP